jgi:hypothetical protein
MQAVPGEGRQQGALRPQTVKSEQKGLERSDKEMAGWWVEGGKGNAR